MPVFQNFTPLWTTNSNRQRPLAGSARKKTPGEGPAYGRPYQPGSLFDAATAISDYPPKSGPFPMKFTGDIVISAPREAVFAKVRDAKFFASCVEGVQELNEIDPDHYTAVLETK